MDPITDLTLTSPFVHSSPESTPTHLPWATLCHSRPYPPSESSLSPSQGLWIWPQVLKEMISSRIGYYCNCKEVRKDFVAWDIKVECYLWRFAKLSSEMGFRDSLLETSNNLIMARYFKLTVKVWEK